MIYEIPFAYPSDTPVSEVFNLLKKFSIEISAQTSWSPHPGEFLIEGTMENLIGFHRELDGPGQSFPVDEFKEYVRNCKLV
jgi:hypothetical protein